MLPRQRGQAHPELGGEAQPAADDHRLRVQGVHQPGQFYGQRARHVVDDRPVLRAAEHILGSRLAGPGGERCAACRPFGQRGAHHDGVAARTRPGPPGQHEAVADAGAYRQVQETGQPLPRAQPRLGRGRGPDVGFHPHLADVREGGREVGVPPVPGGGAGDPAVQRDKFGHGDADAVRLPGGDLAGQRYAVL